MSNKRKVPVVATIVVVAAALTMVGLGFWQLSRLAEKEALLVRYGAAAADPAPVRYPEADQAQVEAVLFRRSQITCDYVLDQVDSIAGRNASGQSGYVHIVHCGTADDGRTAQVQLGWSAGPYPPEPAWQGGTVTGTIAPYSIGFAKLVADPPLAGLEASAPPDPNDLPNNHLAYAVQWFFFALTSLVIYVLALRRKWREQG